MGKLIALAFIGVLALQGNVGRGFSRADSVAPDQFTEGEMVSAVVTMSTENRCGAMATDRTSIEQCPTYTVTITGRGTVTYVGTAGVKTLGLRTHQVPADAARQLAPCRTRDRCPPIHGKASVADRDGRFQIDNVFASWVDYTVRAAGAGFVTAESKIAVKQGSPPIDWNPVMTPTR